MVAGVSDAEVAPLAATLFAGTNANIGSLRLPRTANRALALPATDERLGGTEADATTTNITIAIQLMNICRVMLEDLLLLK